MPDIVSRRSFLGGGASLLGVTFLPAQALLADAGLLEAQSERAQLANARKDEPAPAVTAALGAFVRSYSSTMYSPGMTVALLSGSRLSSLAYGYENVASRSPVGVEQPFWIGSICKSFVGLVALQLRDEGKLDLHKPVLETLPDLPFRNDFGPITCHHLLTHTSGLPDWLQLFASDSSQQARQAYAPGKRFLYSNLGFDTLGYLIAFLDGRSWPEAVTARVLAPLGMTGASGQIDDTVQARMPTAYHFQYGDRPCAVADPLVPVGYVTMANAAGSIAANAHDMALYMQMLARRGRADSGRIVSEEGFRLFTTPYIKAPALSPEASYGYGIGVETIDGRLMLRHTGGTTGFASSILVDLEQGVGAFASINAMQGYRPNPVTRFAVGLLHAEKSGVALPTAPTVEDPLVCKQPAQFAGRYASRSGDVLTVASQGDMLTIASSRGSARLRPVGADTFSASDGTVLDGQSGTGAPSAFGLVFGRGGEAAGSSAPVMDLSYGSEWYAGERSHPAPASARVEHAERYTGTYCVDSPWTEPIRIVERNGKLWLNGTEELHALAGDRFSIVADGDSYDLEFASFLHGQAQVVRTQGDALHRVGLRSV